jgi:tRNA dimethylallyltransferase
MERLVTIVGPTAVGKSRLALRLALDLGGEIISADSRQVYRYMDIGTAKPTKVERSLVPHHLIDIINPDEDFSLAQYRELAYQAIIDIHHRDKLPLLVGGSGLYIRALLEGWLIPRIQPAPEFRRRLEEQATSGGAEELYQELLKLDPVAAQKIDRRNVRRIIRAIEVCKYAGVPFSELQRRARPDINVLVIGINVERAELYRRIDRRVDKMIENGLVGEVKRLVSMGYGFNLPAMSGIGYKQIGMFLRGELSLEASISKIKFETHRFARHQYNWFRLTDPSIKWFDIKQEIETKIMARVAEFIRS